jgi:hypothetical protein
MVDPRFSRPGINLVGYGVGVPSARAGCEDLIADIGANVVRSVSRLDPASARIQTCASGLSGAASTVVGVDFPIRPSEGYLVEARDTVTIELGACP